VSEWISRKTTRQSETAKKAKSAIRHKLEMTHESEELNSIKQPNSEAIFMNGISHILTDHSESNAKFSETTLFVNNTITNIDEDIESIRMD